MRAVLVVLDVATIGGTDSSAGLHRLDVGRGRKGSRFYVSTPNVTHLNGLVDWSPASSSEVGRAQFEGEGSGEGASGWLSCNRRFSYRIFRLTTSAIFY